jgi:FkbM family methyltransferase
MTDGPFVSYAQHGEDVVLWRALGGRPRVVYVDVGAFDPTYDSVTRALYERGWRGVNIEAQPARLEAFLRDRPEDTNLALAVGDVDGEAVLTLPVNPGWASLLDAEATGADPAASEHLTVPVRRLSTILADLGLRHVDVLKVDVEGGEPAVVRGLLDGDVRPVVCVLEGVAPGVGRAAGDEAVALLVGAGYTHCMFDGLNHYLTTDDALCAALSVPANPVDGYVTHQVSEHLAQRESLIASITALSTENAALRRLKTPPVEAAAPRELQSTLAVAESDLPLPAMSRDGIAPPEVLRPPTRRALDPGARAERRRATFRRLLRGEPDAPLTRFGAARPRLLQLSSGEITPDDALSVMYHEILGRAPDSAGHAMWLERIERGDALFDLARDMASSGEAQLRGKGERAIVQADLATWERMLIAQTLGTGDGRPATGQSVTTVGHQLFVGALYEVALRRTPTAGELEHEVGTLVAGVGREWMLRNFAARPQTVARLFGTYGPGWRGRVRRLRDRRLQLQIFRDLVAAAENRQLSLLLADLHRTETAAARPADASPTLEKP